jgi:pimeloyl-ACP methyl ester carboxylesterase
MKKRHVFIAVAACLAILGSAWTLLEARQGLDIEPVRVGEIPARIFRPVGASSGHVALIAHGFAGSQQLMQPMAMTLAHSGYTAITFDFAGHGRNARPMRGGVKDMEASTRTLTSEIDEMADFARGLSGGKPIALIGHSMAADLIAQYAMDRPGIGAVAALSVFGAGITRDQPPNLIVITGEWEPAMLTEAAARIAGLAADGPAQERVTYGDFAKGTARRYVLAEGAEHIGVIYSRDGLTQTRDWLNAAFGETAMGAIDARGKWLALLFGGLLALAYPLSQLQPALSPKPLGAGLGWKRLAPLAIAPAILTPLILWKAPTDFLPILLGDYLAAHFVVYGLLTVGGLCLARSGAPKARTDWRRPLVPALFLAAWYILGLGAPIDAFVTSFMPSALRWVIIAPMFVATALYFLCDEWLTRGEGAAQGGYAFSKLCFIASLLGAVALNPQKLFFLIIIVPVIFIFFIVYGLVSRWTYARTGDPRVAALGNAAGLAFAIAVTFPIVG